MTIFGGKFLEHFYQLPTNIQVVHTIFKHHVQRLPSKDKVVKKFLAFMDREGSSL